MRKDRASYGDRLRELGKAQGKVETLQECVDVLGEALVHVRGQRDALRMFADQVDLTVGLVKLMLEAGMPVEGRHIARILDEALEDACKRTGGVRTPMREGMTSEELTLAARAFLGALDEGEPSEGCKSTPPRLRGADTASPCDDSEHEGEGAA